MRQEEWLGLDDLVAKYDDFHGTVNYLVGLLNAAGGDPTKVKYPTLAQDLEAELVAVDWTTMIRETER